MPRPTKRQPRAVISVSIAMKPDFVRTQRAAAMQGMTVSEYVRGCIRTENAKLLDTTEAPIVVAPQSVAA
jgi:hypothetical protein